MSIKSSAVLVCPSCDSEISLRPCCGMPPVLKLADDVYSGAVRYECLTCHATTLASYSTLGNSMLMAAKVWNNKAMQIRKLVIPANSLF